jgi:NAD(P)-dependent dehydrogenase (short-subunit alcohol dehydrogenase family)
VRQGGEVHDRLHLEGRPDRRLLVTARRFEGRVALVTGAASGIGAATARRLASEGAAVALVDLSAEATARVAAEIGGTARGFACDMASSAAVTAVAREIERALGPVDLLANVAGIGDPGGLPIERLEDALWQSVLAVNLSGPFFLCRAILPGMAERGRGAVVNVSSLAGRTKSALGGLAYTASKSGLLGLTRHLAFDYGPRGVRVNAICPGAVDTPMIRTAAKVGAAQGEAIAAKRAAHSAALRALMPIPRISTPDEQAAAIAFLASDDASYINGVSLDVNGGLFMA